MRGAGGGTYDLSIRKESEKEGGRGLCRVEQHVDLEDRDVRTGKREAPVSFGHKQPSQGGEEEVGQPGECAFGLFLFFIRVENTV